MNSLCTISGHGFRGKSAVPILFTVPYTTSTITIAGYSATPTGFKIKWIGGDALTVYTNNTSSMTFTVNGTSLFPVITYDGTNIFAVFTGLTNIAWSVVITSKVGTLASGSISIPQAPSSLSAGGTTYTSNSTPIVQGSLGPPRVGQPFTTNYTVTSSFSRMYCSFSCNLPNNPTGGHYELANLLESGYDTYNWGIDIYVDSGLLGVGIGIFPQNASTPNMGATLTFDTTTNVSNGTNRTFKLLFTPTSIYTQVDSGSVQTIGPIGTLFYAGTNYNFVSAWMGSNWGYGSGNTFTNLLVTN